MTITKYDRVAILPKRCDKCNRLFWLEPYNIFYKLVGIEEYPLKQIECKDCIGKIHNILDLPSVNPQKSCDTCKHSDETDGSNCYECVKGMRDNYDLQEPKTGHWKSFTHSAYHGIDDDGEPIWREVKVYHCNLCNRRTVIKENYCPNCGAKMESEE